MNKLTMVTTTVGTVGNYEYFNTSLVAYSLMHYMGGAIA